MTKEEYRSNNQWHGIRIYFMLKNKKENPNSLNPCILLFFLIKLIYFQMSKTTLSVDPGVLV